MGRHARLPDSVLELQELLAANAAALAALPRGDPDKLQLHTERSIVRKKLQSLGAEAPYLAPGRRRVARGQGPDDPPLPPPPAPRVWPRRWDPATGRCVRCGGLVLRDRDEALCLCCGPVGPEAL